MNYDVLRYFDFIHLPPKLQEVSRPFHDLAKGLAATLPQSRETEKALDLLLASKDAAVRSALDLV